MDQERITDFTTISASGNFGTVIWELPKEMQEQFQMVHALCVAEHNDGECARIMQRQFSRFLEAYCMHLFAMAESPRCPILLKIFSEEMAKIALAMADLDRP